jgi:hypothetical protein
MMDTVGAKCLMHSEEGQELCAFQTDPDDMNFKRFDRIERIERSQRYQNRFREDRK